MANSDARREMQTQTLRLNKPNAKWRWNLWMENGRDKCLAKRTGDDNDDDDRPSPNRNQTNWCVHFVCVFIFARNGKSAAKRNEMNANERNSKAKKKANPTVDGHCMRLTGILCDTLFPRDPECETEMRKIKQKSKWEGARRARDTGPDFQWIN